ncbi:MAG TPA: isoprenylcysteine carboxylmethyltransferase family protein [Pseudomonadales bacterium]|nr:isoprenylcysteine carboxylmethyltransferase family protein [Pseudomonadales bacterium]HRG50052.1 isoprenylcysteine carboxylmethyltransferase family protein [Pseudomonadales bacterium]
MKIENKIPPPVVALFFGVVMWLISSDPQDPISTTRILGIFACWLIGTYFSVSALLLFRKAKTTVNPLQPQSATSLVVSGVFSLSRNPMYVGVAFILLAWSIYLGSSWALLGVVGFVIFINQFQIAPEERAMLALFGEEFVSYSKKVRRWL